MTQFYYNEPDKLTLSKEGKAYIIGIEGICLDPYLDDYPKGEWTIGIGTTRFDGLTVKGHPPITIEQSLELFLKHVEKYENNVRRLITKPMTQQEFDAFVSFEYNTGALNKATATKLFNQGASKESVVKALQLYNRDNGRIVKGLVRRRKEEGDIFLNGVYAGGGNVLVTRANSAGKEIQTSAKTVNIMSYL